VFEKRVLKRIFWSKREDVAVGWRRLHNEEFHNLYASSNIVRVIKSRRLRWAGDVVCMGEMRSAYEILIEKPILRREENIRMDARETEWEGVNWICLTLGKDQWWALVCMVMSL
jgi:hypothetical protein